MIFKDSLFSIGSTHEVCEDYSLSGGDLINFCIVSDGCSGADNSDIGSRALSHALKKCIEQMGPRTIMTSPASVLVAMTYDVARSSMLSLGVDLTCLHATLLFALADTKNDLVRIIMVGDGFLSIKTF